MAQIVCISFVALCLLSAVFVYCDKRGWLTSKRTKAQVAVGQLLGTLGRMPAALLRNQQVQYACYWLGRANDSLSAREWLAAEHMAIVGRRLAEGVLREVQ